MKAFHSDPEIKKKYLDRVLAHQEADEIVKRVYWKEGKGCAIGCTLHSDNHKGYETELGIPEWLARVEDTLFEGMSLEKSKAWAADFLNAVNVGADLQGIKSSFMVIVLTSTLDTFNHNKYPLVKKTIVSCIEAWKDGSIYNTDVRKSIKKAAYAADATSTASAAASAAYAADAADAAYAAASAAYAAASAAAYDAYDAASAASARKRTCGFFADELIKLLKECK